MPVGLLIAMMAAFAATPAAAYIGPGVGAGTIAVVLGVLGAIAMAFVAVLWYPIKRLLKRKKTPATDAAQSSGGSGVGPGAGSGAAE
ncbi:MAG: hypothetical protein AAF577_01385 [Pseudomonadota bacterium]